LRPGLLRRTGTMAAMSSRSSAQFNSSPHSQVLRKLLAEQPCRQLLLPPALPPRAGPAESPVAPAGLRPLTFVGSSLGGFTPRWRKVRCLRCFINPAITPHTDWANTSARSRTSIPAGNGADRSAYWGVGAPVVHPRRRATC
jgi:hypothetical protein